MKLTKQQIKDWSSTDLHSMNIETGTRNLAEDLCAMRLIAPDTVTIVSDIIADGDTEDAQYELDSALDGKGLSLEFSEDGQWATLNIFDEDKLDNYLAGLG